MPTGLALIILSGIITGCAVVPMKYATKWKWENIWLVFTGIALLAIPSMVVLFTVPGAWVAYRAAKTSAVSAAVLFGLGWGIGSTLSGIGYTMLGIGLGVSVVLGLTASIGSILPLILLFPNRLVSGAALVLYAGVSVMLLGLGLSAHAGRLRQAQRTQGETTSGADLKGFAKGDIRVGLVVCIASAILSSMFNLALVFGDDIRLKALALGASPMEAVNTLWLPVEVASFVANLVYCVYLLTRNKSWPLYWSAGSGSHWLIGLLMGGLWMGSISLYGLGAGRLGALGPIIGFPVYMSTSILAANVAGLITREWAGSSRMAYVYGMAGMLALIASVVIIGVGNNAFR